MIENAKEFLGSDETFPLTIEVRSWSYVSTDSGELIAPSKTYYIYELNGTDDRGVWADVTDEDYDSRYVPKLHHMFFPWVNIVSVTWGV